MKQLKLKNGGTLEVITDIESGILIVAEACGLNLSLLLTPRLAASLVFEINEAIARAGEQ